MWHVNLLPKVDCYVGKIIISQEELHELLNRKYSSNRQLDRGIRKLSAHKQINMN